MDAPTIIISAWTMLGLLMVFAIIAAVLFDSLSAKKERRKSLEKHTQKTPEPLITARIARVESAREFWERIGFTEEILGRRLTEKETWRLMQQGEWHCVGCGERLEKIDNKTVECPICSLKFQKDNAKSKIKCIANTGEII